MDKKLNNYAVFTLFATMASFGDAPGNMRKTTRNYPGRSGVIGLIAAALGISRNDRENLAKLDKLKLAVGVINEGIHLSDYHTVQTIGKTKNKDPITRMDAINSSSDRETIITKRDYRVGVGYVIAVWFEEDCDSLIDEIAIALNHPVYTLFLGRKSCPLSFPPCAFPIRADNYYDALSVATRPPFIQASPIIKIITDDPPIGSDGENKNYTVERRSDVPHDREKWTFKWRDTYIENMSGA